MAVRKVILSKAKVEPKVVLEEAPKVAEVEEEQSVRTKKGCSFCQAKTTPNYTDLATLRRYLTDRAKILPKGRSGVCSKHQRQVSKNIKYARHLSLLPFVPKV